MSYCIYLRKSRMDLEAEARGEGETLTRHKKALFEHAKKLNLNIVKIYSEVVSGETIASRPVMQELLANVEQDLWDGVFVMEVERLARGDTIDQGIVAQTFKFSNTKIITPAKTYDPNNEFDEEYFEFGLFMSRREYKTINRRLQRGRISSVKEGKYVGNTPPYGYSRKKLIKDKGFSLEVIQEQANIVKFIFGLYTNGELQSDGTYRRLGVSLIVRKLNDLGIPTMKGDVWVPGTIQCMLKNPVYIGKIRWNCRPAVKKMISGQIHKERPVAKPENWLLVDGMHEPIIDIETWNKTQHYLSNNSPRPIPAKKTIQNPLCGLIVCGVCGRKMIRRPYGGRQDDTLMCPVTSCHNISSKLLLVEKRILSILKEWLKSFELDFDRQETFMIDNKENKDILLKAITRIDADMITIKKQTDNIHNLLEQGIYTTDIFLERMKHLTTKLEDLQHSEKKLKEDLKQQEVQEESFKIIIPQIRNVVESYYLNDNPVYRNELLKELIEKVVYFKDTNGRTSGILDNFKLTIYPKFSTPINFTS